MYFSFFIPIMSILEWKFLKGMAVFKMYPQTLCSSSQEEEFNSSLLECGLVLLVTHFQPIEFVTNNAILIFLIVVKYT